MTSKRTPSDPDPVPVPVPATLPAPASSAITPSRTLAAFALALLLGLQPVTTDVYLPSLPMLTKALQAPMHAVQLTMSALILSFGMAQMVWGPVADRIGRRPVLLMGLALYTAASAGAMTADTIETLVVWRVLQGAALAAAVVCARAIVRDLYEPADGAQVMALALSGLGVIALTGPLLGGFAATWLGWRGPLMLVTLVGLLVLVFIAWRLPETLLNKNPQATRLAPLLQIWWHIGRNRSFVAWATLLACTYGGLFTILAASSFIYMDVFGLSPAAYGASMALGSLSYIAGTVLCRRWIPRHGLHGTVRRGAWFTLLAGAAMASLAAAGMHALWAVLVPQCLFVFAHGLHQPCGQVAAVGPFPQNAGAASALAGLLLALVAFGIGKWLGFALNGSVQPMAYGVAFWSLMTCASAWVLVQRIPR